ncbi:MAG: Flp pilus assembly protein CpaB [Actinomycetota bacterium]|nr:Flp pilus assembly protein CpaB [Actinomycetota bacterium]
MRTKIVILVAALVLGGIAAVLAANYLSSARSDIVASNEPIDVLVAQEDIPRGMTAEDLLSQKLIALEEVPRRFVAAGAISSDKGLEGKVLVAPMTTGEQVTDSRFEVPSTAGLAYSIPNEYVALSIPVDEVRGISGLVKPGNYVALFATMPTDGTTEGEFTRMLLADVKVLAVGGTMNAEQTTATGNDTKQGGLGTTRDENTGQPMNTRTLTISITPADAERVVLASSAGSIWVALLPAAAEELPTTSGRTAETLFK